MARLDRRMTVLEERLIGVAVWVEYVKLRDALLDYQMAGWPAAKQAEWRRMSRLALAPPIWPEMPAALREIVERIMAADPDAFQAFGQYRTTVESKEDV